MARYIGPKNKLARKIGEDLGLRTNPLKVGRRLNVRPGQHGAKSRRKQSDYAIQLKEKQKGYSKKGAYLYSLDRVEFESQTNSFLNFVSNQML